MEITLRGQNSLKAIVKKAASATGIWIVQALNATVSNVLGMTKAQLLSKQGTSPLRQRVNRRF